MTENVKTSSFFGVAVVVALVAVLTYPNPPGVDPHEEEGKKLFPDFTKPEAVAGIKIVKFDEAAATLSRFEVVELDGEWSIATQENYPADAEDRVNEAATSVMGLYIVSFVTKSAAQHVTYGVVEPDAERIKVGSTGVGMMVTLLDSKAEHLMRPLIIGKQVEDRDELRYVRRAGQDAVYTVKVNTDKLSTKFNDWINQDLLELTPGDVERLVLNDYVIVTTIDQLRRPIKSIEDKAKLIFSYEDAKWRLSQYEQVDKQGNMVSATLADDEEVDSSKLDDMKFALDDLEIASVERKVKALADQFRSGGTLSVEKVKGESRLDLQDRGFFAQPLPDGAIRIFSDAGDAVVGTGEGIEYVLRFGMIDPTSQPSDDKATEGDGSGDDDSGDDDSGDDDGGGENGGGDAGSELSLNRYVLVVARLNTDLIDKPTLEEVPPEPKTTEPADNKQPPAKDVPADKKEPDKKQPDGTKGPEGDEGKQGETETNEPAKKPTEKSAAPADQDAPAAAKDGDAKDGDAKDGDAKDGDAKKDDAEKEDAKKEDVKNGDAKNGDAKDGDAKNGDAKDGDAKKEDVKDGDAKDGDAKESDAAEKPTPEEVAKQAAEARQRIIDENKRKQEDYDEKIKDAKEKVQKLNDRFADWYFVVSEDVYKKIRLGRDDVIKKKEAKEEAIDEPGGLREFPDFSKPLPGAAGDN